MNQGAPGTSLNYWRTHTVQISPPRNRSSRPASAALAPGSGGNHRYPFSGATTRTVETGLSMLFGFVNFILSRHGPRNK